MQIKHFHSDNHPFDAQEWKDDLETHEQTWSHSGVGAHHQNGVSKRAIQTVTYWARALMMHQLLHWPDQFDASLWPFALEHAVHIWNHMPRSEHGFSPLELFTGMKQPSGNKTLLDTRVWGCPAWVLDPTLQDGHKLPKWNKCS